MPKNKLKFILFALTPTILLAVGAELAARFILTRPTAMEIKKIILATQYDRYNFVEYGPLTPYERDHELFWRIKANLSSKLESYDLYDKQNPAVLQFNRLGCRGGNEMLADDYKDAKYRLLFLGESSVLAFGATDDLTIPAKITHYLKNQYGERNVVGMNCAVPGYSSYQILKQLKILAPMLRPTHVIVGFGYNDSNESTITDEDFYNQSKSWWFGSVKSAINRSVLFKTLQYYVMTWSAKDHARKSADGKSSRRVSAQQLQQYLQEMRHLLSAKGAKLMVMNTNFTPEQYHRQATMDYCQEHKIPFIDLPVFIKRFQQEYSENLQRIWQKTIVNEIRDRNIIIPVLLKKNNRDSTLSIRWYIDDQQGDVPMQRILIQNEWQLFIGTIGFDIKPLNTATYEKTVRYRFVENGRIEFDHFHLDVLKFYRSTTVPHPKPQYILLEPQLFNKIPFMSEKVHPDMLGYKTLGEAIAPIIDKAL